MDPKFDQLISITVSVKNDEKIIDKFLKSIKNLTNKESLLKALKLVPVNTVMKFVRNMKLQITELSAFIWM